MRQMQEMARRIAKVSKEYKLPVVEDEYVASFKVELMDAVVQWCRGASFYDICKVSTRCAPFSLPRVAYFAHRSSPTNLREA